MITDSVTGLASPASRSTLLPPNGEVGFSSAITTATGDYISEGGTVTGTVYAVTTNTLGYQNEVWDDVKCGNCDITAVGTPMLVTIGVTTGGFDFALDIGGRITGTVRDVNLVPIANVEIRPIDSAGNSVESAVTDASGNFASGGLLVRELLRRHPQCAGFRRRDLEQRHLCERVLQPGDARRHARRGDACPTRRATSTSCCGRAVASRARSRMPLAARRSARMCSSPFQTRPGCSLEAPTATTSPASSSDRACRRARTT